MTTQISESLPLVPSPREWFASDGTFTLHLGTRVIAEDRRLLEDARTFAQDVGALIGQHLPVEVAESPRTGDLLIGLVDTAPQHAEGYEVAIGESVRITSRTLLGVKRATQTVAQLIAFHPSGHLPHGTIRDWPWVPERGIMLDVGRRYYAPEYIEDLIRTAAWYKLNVVHLHLTEWNAFRLDSPRFPGLAADEAYTRDDIDRFEAIARRYGVTILPEIDLPSHATPITTYWPETVWPCQPMNAERGHNFTVDVTNPRTREIVKDLLDEFVPWFSGPRFHIGADEYPYQSTQEQCQELVRYAEANGFANTSDVMVDFIDYMAAIVREHGKTAQAWGWWDAAGSPSRGPDARIVVEAYGDDIFAEGAAGARHMLDRGYQVVHADGNQLYVTPGLDLLPDTERLYAHWPVPNDPNHPNLLGYLVSRWADEREDEP
ncbi:MAG TPA: beta-N-acetylhexosaminidase, partial [Actinopolymorphaceae bacterium]